MYSIAELSSHVVRLSIVLGAQQNPKYLRSMAISD